MPYLMTIWLFWTPVEGVLVEYAAETCSTALNEILAEVAGDGVTSYRVVSCVKEAEV